VASIEFRIEFRDSTGFCQTLKFVACRVRSCA
jgi:hypothetical protein